MIKDFFANMGIVFVIIGFIAMFVAPALIPAILVIKCGFSGWWFLLLLLWIPEISLCMTLYNEADI